MAAKINLGVIGTGWITQDYVSHSLATGKFSLGAVYSRKQDTAKEFADKYVDQKASLYTSVDELASDKNIDAVYIASPNLLHYEQAKTILNADKHVILEKPATATEKQLDELFKLAEEKKVVLVEAYRHLQESNFKIIKQSIPKVGKLLGANISYAQFSSRFNAVLKGEKPGVFDLAMAGGALVDLGVYLVAAAIELFGEPESSVYYPIIIATGADGGGTIIFKYKDFSATLTPSKVYNSTAPCEIYGEKGTISWPTVTDIESVTFWDPQKKGSKEELGVQREKLNLKEEALEHARIIQEKDWEAMKRWEAHSRSVVRVTEGLRRANGLLFPGEE